MRTLYMESVNSVYHVAALVALASALAGAFIRQARERTFEVDERTRFRFQLYTLLAATYRGHLSPNDWDVGYYLERTTLKPVKLALERLLAA